MNALIFDSSVRVVDVENFSHCAITQSDVTKGVQTDVLGIKNVVYFYFINSILNAISRFKK